MEFKPPIPTKVTKTGRVVKKYKTVIIKDTEPDDLHLALRAAKRFMTEFQKEKYLILEYGSEDDPVTYIAQAWNSRPSIAVRVYRLYKKKAEENAQLTTDDYGPNNDGSIPSFDCSEDYGGEEE